MKTRSNAGASAEHTQILAAERQQIPLDLGWRKRLACSLGIALAIALALLFSQEAKSNDKLQLEGYGLEGSWINTVSPILPPGVPPISFQTYVTVSALEPGM